jgi:hypothetical protein
MLDWVFKVTQLTAATATLVMSGLIAINKEGETWFFFLLFRAIFTIVLRLIEQQIFVDNVYHDRYRQKEPTVLNSR